MKQLKKMLTFLKTTFTSTSNAIVSFIDRPANGLFSIATGASANKYGSQFLTAAEDWERWLAFFVTWIGGLGTICVGLYWTAKMIFWTYTWITRKKNKEEVFREEDFD